MQIAPGDFFNVPDFYVPLARAANFPWVSHAAWFYGQLVRWGYAPWSDGGARMAAATYRPDLYREALAPLGVSLPSANSKVEGSLLRETAAGSTRGDLLLGPDGFFDGHVFDPDDLASYLRRQGVQ